MKFGWFNAIFGDRELLPVADCTNLFDFGDNRLIFATFSDFSRLF